MASGPKIISNGQAGVARGALDAALDTDTPCGGHCPPDRHAEDGAIPETYPLTPVDSTEPDQSVRCNVLASDGTLVIYFGSLDNASTLTERLCLAHSKPLLKLDAKATETDKGEQTLFDFLRKYSIHTLHVIGPRRSEAPQGRDYAYRLLVRLLRR